MPTPSVTEPAFTTHPHGATVSYEVDTRVVAIIFPHPAPLNPDAWYVSLLDPGPECNPCGATAFSEDDARAMAELFARTAARAVTR